MSAPKFAREGPATPYEIDYLKMLLELVQIFRLEFVASAAPCLSGVLDSVRFRAELFDQEVFGCFPCGTVGVIKPTVT